MDDPRRPLIPQFSLRWILAATAVLAVVSLVGSQALRGEAWGIGCVVALVLLVIAFLVYAALFLIALLVARMAESRQSRGKNRPALPTEAAASSQVSTTTATVLLIIGLLAACSQSVWGATGGQITYPILGPGETNKTGLTLTVNSSWVDGPAYRPMSFEFKSITGPVVADRVLEVQLRIVNWNRTLRTIAQTIEIPAGQTSAKGTIAVPQHELWNQEFEWKVFEDGKQVFQLSSLGTSSFNGNSSYYGDGGPPSILALSGLGQLSTNHLTIFGQTEDSVLYVGAISTALPVTTGLRTNTGIPSLADLPTRWIDYSNIEVIITSLDQLQTLIEKHPEQWQAIQKWLQSGGSLFVYGIGTKWQQLEKLESLIELKQQPAGMSAQVGVLAMQDAPEKIVERGWTLPIAALQDLPLNGYDSRTATGTATGDPPLEEQKPKKPPTFDDAPFLFCSYGDGVIAAIRSDDKFKGDDFPWPWLYNSIGAEHRSWFLRYGMSLTRENLDFWNFLIPGVGAAPVTMFQVLITLFVVVIGPLNYLLLRRAGKLNLMVFSIPICAGVVTAGLLIYAILSDGFEVRLQGRSFTQIDQRRGEASCWARLSYYAGLPPSGGLTFSEQTAVLPLQPDGYRYRGYYPRKSLDWIRLNPSDANSPLEQRLTDGWIKSRTPTQFVTVRMRKTDAKLVIDETDAAGPPKVENQLGTEIEALLIVADNGKCYTATDVANGKSATLTPVDSQNAAAVKILQQMNENDPERQWLDSGNHGAFVVSRSYSSGLYYGNDSSDPRQGTGVMERSFRGLREKLEQSQLTPRSYVAIVKTSPEMETGTPSAKEESSFHVVYGVW